MHRSVQNRVREESVWFHGLHFATLASLAAIFPVYSLFEGKSISTTPSERINLLLAIGLLALLLPALAQMGLLLLHRLSPRAERSAARFLISCLASLVALQVLRVFWSAPGPLLLTEATGCGFVAAWCYRDLPGMRRFMTLLSPALLLVPLSLLLAVTGRVALDERSTGPFPRVIIVVVREWPLLALLDERGEIDSLRFPNLAGLARQADWFRNATAVADTPDLSLTALSEGSYPGANGPARSLWSSLSPTYELRGHEPGQRLPGVTDTALGPARFAASSLRLFLPPDVVSGMSGLPFLERRLGADQRDLEPPTPDYASGLEHSCEEFRNFIRSIRETPQPVADVFYLRFPEPIPSEFKARLLGQMWESWARANDVDTETRLTEQRGLREQMLRHHSLQSSLVDALIGELIAHLKERGLYDNTLLLLTADQGSLVPSLRALLSIPCILKRPAQTEGHRNTRNLETIDILPTLLDTLGFGETRNVTGVSAFSSSPPRETKRLYSHTGTSTTIDARSFGQPAEEGTDVEPPGSLFRSPAGAGPDAALLGLPVRRERVVALPPEFPVIRLRRHHFLEKRDGSVLYRVPDLIQGKLHVDVLPSRDLRFAVAVDNIIRETAGTSPLENSDGTFSALLEDGAAAEFKHVEIFAIREEEKLPLLQNTHQIWPPRSLLHNADGKEFVLLENGRKLEVGNDTIQGWVVAGTSGGQEEYFVGGWAVETAQPSLVETVATFLNGRTISSGPTDLERPEAVQMFSDNRLLRSGFRQTFSLPSTMTTENARVRVLAVSGKAAGELHYPASSENWPFAIPGAARPDAEREYRWGDTLTFGESGNAAPYLGAGWGRASGGVSWTIGRVATLHLSTSPVSENVTLEAFFKPFLAPPGLRSQRVEVLVDEEVVGVWAVSKDEFEIQRLEIPPDSFPAGSDFILQFRTPDASSPAAQGTGRDERLLGIAMVWLRLNSGPEYSHP